MQPEIDLRKLAERRDQRGGERDEGTVRVAVADEGPGIPEEWRERIFEPYARLETHTARGSGIGLYAAKRLAAVFRKKAQEAVAAPLNGEGDAAVPLVAHDHGAGFLVQLRLRADDQVRELLVLGQRADQRQQDGGVARLRGFDAKRHGEEAKRRALSSALKGIRCGCFVPDLTRLAALPCGEARHCRL